MYLSLSLSLSKINPSKRSEICVCDVTELWELIFNLKKVLVSGPKRRTQLQVSEWLEMRENCGKYHIWLYVAKVSYFGQFGVDVGWQTNSTAVLLLVWVNFQHVSECQSFSRLLKPHGPHALPWQCTIDDDSPDTYIRWQWIGWHHSTGLKCQQDIVDA